MSRVSPDYLRLSVDDLLNFAPGQGGFSISGSDVPEAPVEMGCEEAPLDFTPRMLAGPGQQPGDLHCDGRWGFAGDVPPRIPTPRLFRHAPRRCE